MQSLFDQPNPPPQQTLLDELEIIDKAMLEGDATEEQERRGQEIVELCDDAPRLKAEVERLTKELEREQGAHEETRREWRKMRRRLLNYQHLDGLYRSMREAAQEELSRKDGGAA